MQDQGLHHQAEADAACTRHPDHGRLVLPPSAKKKHKEAKQVKNTYTLAQVVKTIMEEDKLARNSDSFLYLKVL